MPRAKKWLRAFTTTKWPRKNKAWPLAVGGSVHRLGLGFDGVAAFEVLQVLVHALALTL